MNLKVKLLLIIALAAPALGSALAGNETKQTNVAASQFKNKEENDILNHLEQGESVKETYKPIELKARKTVKFNIKVKQKANPVKTCHANMSIGYLQFDTKARVDTTIDNSDCAASSGQYQIILQLIDQNGKARFIQHIESWARNNDAQVVASKFYNIGSNAELMRVKVQDLTCTCTSKTASDSK